MFRCLNKGAHGIKASYCVCIVSHAAEAEKEFGQTSLKTYTSTFVPLYHAVTQKKVKTHMKMICLLPTEKVWISSCHTRWYFIFNSVD